MLFSASQDRDLQARVQLVTRIRSLQTTDHVIPTPYFQIDPSHGTIVLGNNRLFHLGNVLPFDCPQQAIFKGYVEPIVNACFDGFNITVIAYGQTGSGKTFTIFGPGLLYTMNESDFGMVPRTVRNLFYKAKEYPGRQISIQASYLEIYDEEIHDLLSMEPFHGEITVQENQNGEIIITGATQMECHTIDDVFSCLETGLALRHTGPMLNQLSSRSHGIFTLYMQQAWTQDGCLYEVCSKLHFVDLAGSERLGLGVTSNHGNDDTQLTGFQEPFSINSGLLALSNVTAALGDPRRKASHVPYWDSKLTYILKDSLGGNAFTLMIVCLSPSASDLEETTNTLKFASRAANICNRPVANVRLTPIANIPLMAMDYDSQQVMVNLKHSMSLVTKSLVCACDSRFNFYINFVEEVSEPTPTRELSSELSNRHDRSSIDSSSDGSHFTEQLDILRQQFRETTDRLISSIESMYDNATSLEWGATNPIDLSQHAEFDREQSTSNYKSGNTSPKPLRTGRRVSIFGLSNAVDQQPLIGETLVSTPESVNNESSSNHPIEGSLKVGGDAEDDACREMRHSAEISEKRQLLAWKTNKQLKKAHQTLEELKRTVSLKEEYVDFTRESKENEQPKTHQEKIQKSLKQDKVPHQSDLNIPPRHRKQSEDNSDECSSPIEQESDNVTDGERTIGQQRAEIIRFEHCLKNMAELLDLTARAPRKVGELERSLSIMKDQQSVLKEQLRQENEKKKELKQEIEKDHVRIVELERQLQEQRVSSEMRFLELCSDKDGTPGESELEHKWRWLVAEEERLVELRTAITWRSEELEEKQSILEKREIALDKSKNLSETEKSHTSSIGDVGSKRKKDMESNDKIVQTSGSSFLKYKLSDLQSISGNDNPTDKEAIRKEIRKMRHTRDSLVQQRQELDERQHRGRDLDASEERRMLELDEAIEAVDAAIEYKNEVICSRHYELKSSVSVLWQTEDGLLCRLMSLTHTETRSLLCKYFQKVIDLREGSKKMEQQFAELEAQFEDQSRYVRKLSAALKHTQLEMERRQPSHQRHYEPKATTVQRQLDQDSSVCGGGGYDGDGKLSHLDDESEYQNSRDLRRQLRDLLSVTPKHRTGGNSNAVSGVVPVTSELAPSACSSRTPSLLGLQAVQALHQKITGLHRMRGRQTAPETTTTVTREKNKLIIKQQTVQPETRDTKRRHR
ncbi:hypothetical protein DAPPUDRAFT_319054 [Daphnia pulex]|uniref:Kinesin motor domain-containing protein n=1 Tax=Daphnia pulex TaxID=6669 RepID=E9GKJ5_DAPPU|nr:hypothetical protein DAPPUDRAFT_319054 [Daphnia pulex]|eukprot:EFX80055.1 hypothetical protein DAPPUDRAFT_319054 [Daphnia pulex]